MKRLFVFLLACLLNTVAFAQSEAEAADYELVFQSQSYPDYELTYQEDSPVAYRLNEGGWTRRGQLEEIRENHLVIDGVEYALEDFRSIRMRNKRTERWGILVLLSSTALFTAVFADIKYSDNRLFFPNQMPIIVIMALQGLLAVMLLGLGMVFTSGNVFKLNKNRWTVSIRKIKP